MSANNDVQLDNSESPMIINWLIHIGITYKMLKAWKIQCKNVNSQQNINQQYENSYIWTTGILLHL